MPPRGVQRLATETEPARLTGSPKPQGAEALVRCLGEPQMVEAAGLGGLVPPGQLALLCPVLPCPALPAATPTFVPLQRRTPGLRVCLRGRVPKD